MRQKFQIIRNCQIGKGTKIWSYVNLYECQIGENCMVGAFVEIQNGVKIGKNVRVQSHSFICEGVTIENDVFIGHHVVFINDKYPRVTNTNWELLKTKVRKGASIGSNVTIMGGVVIGERALVGAGSVVLEDVPSNTIVAGNPARLIGKVKN